MFGWNKDGGSCVKVLEKRKAIAAFLPSGRQQMCAGFVRSERSRGIMTSEFVNAQSAWIGLGLLVGLFVLFATERFPPVTVAVAGAVVCSSNN